MLRERIVGALGRLSLYGMRGVIDEVLVTGIKQRSTPEKILLDLLEAELAERKAKSIKYQMGLAKFPVTKDLDRFDFDSSPVDEVHIRSLLEGRFLAEHGNVILVGGTGTGKTHLAVAMGRQAIRNGKRGRFFNLVDLVNRLEQEKLNNQGGKLAESLTRQDFVVLDELGYLPFSRNGGQLLFHLVSKLYERTSLIITTNLPFERWVEVLGSERLTGATLDRLTHRCHIIESNGESYRLKDARRRREGKAPGKAGESNT